MARPHWSRTLYKLPIGWRINPEKIQLILILIILAFGIILLGYFCNIGPLAPLM